MDASDRFSILGCGPRLRRALLDNPEFTAITDRVVPVISETDQPMPFVTFFRASASETPVKGTAGPREAIFQFQIFTADWSPGLALAEIVARTLNGYADTLIRRCTWEDSSENFDMNVPAFVQILTFKVKI